MWLGLEKVWSRKKQSEVLLSWLLTFLPTILRNSVADPDGFGPPGSIRKRSGSGFFYYQAKN